jgi:transposase
LDCGVDDERLRRHDLTDAEWARLGPLLPGHPRQGHRWNDHRLVIDGVFHRVRAGCPWRDLPERFGNWKTVYNRHRRWSGDGTWETILDRLRAGCDEAEGAAWAVAADATVVRAHQHAAGARRRPPADIDPARLAPAVLSAPARARG